MLLKLSPLLLLIIFTGCTSFPIPSGSKHILSSESKPYEQVISRKRSGYTLKCDYRSSTKKLQVNLCELSAMKIDKISEKTSINEYYYTLIGFYPHYTSAFWGKPSPLSGKNAYGIATWADQTAWTIITLFYPWIQTQTEEFNRAWKPYDGSELDDEKIMWQYAVLLGWAKTSRCIRSVDKNIKRLTRTRPVPIGKDFTIEIINPKTKHKKTFKAKNGNIYIPYTMLPRNFRNSRLELIITCKKYNCHNKTTICK